MNELKITKIENLIYEVRGVQVMLDSDLAKLYGCKNGTKDINKAVNRNIDKFPEDFYFQLTVFEVENLRFQFGTAKISGKNRILPHVFTEEGVAMLATILRTESASKVSVDIMRTFVKMRHFINENKDLFKRITKVEYELLKQSSRINELFNTLECKKIENQKIFFYGEIYDAYSLIIELIKHANKRIIIIDNYIDKSILDMLVYKKDSVKVKLITSSNYLTKLDINKFNKQYPNLEIKYSKLFHDRFLIIDNNLYHIGASLKDLGKRCFGISKIEDNNYLDKILLIIN